MTTLLDRFASTLAPEESHILADVQRCIEWQAMRGMREFTPSAYDDVDLRTYLLDLRTGDAEADPETLQRTVRSLKRFYGWAQAEGLIEASPFESYNFERPFLSRDQIRQRQDTPVADPRERENARLRALNLLAEHLNRSTDVQGALDATLEALVRVMDLQTAWVSLLTDRDSAIYNGNDVSALSPGNFVLAAAYGLPPGLEQGDCLYLRRPPDCHCQSLLRDGRLTRAVNVVECSRLRDLAEAAGDTRGLLFHATVPLVSHGRPLGLLSAATSEWQFLTAGDLQLLSAVGAQVAIAIERARLYDLTQVQRARLERELQMAREVQASLLPSQLPSIPGFGLAADWHSAREMAGDFYDIYALPDGHWGIVIADVSDKGAPAALYMAMACSLIRAEAMRASSPAKVLMRVNQALLAQSSAEMFVTVFYAILDPASRTLTYANAGHNPPIMRRASVPGRIEPLAMGGTFLGMFDKVSLTDAVAQLDAGDALVAYTDGVTDAENPRRENYDVARLTAAIETGPATAQALLAHILADLAAFTEGMPQPDDITLFVVAREAAPS